MIDIYCCLFAIDVRVHYHHLHVTTVFAMTVRRTKFAGKMKYGFDESYNWNDADAKELKNESTENNIGLAVDHQLRSPIITVSISDCSESFQPKNNWSCEFHSFAMLIFNILWRHRVIVAWWQRIVLICEVRVRMTGSDLFLKRPRFCVKCVNGFGIGDRTLLAYVFAIFVSVVVLLFAGYFIFLNF